MKPGDFLRNRLKELRVLQGLTTREVAARMKTSQSRVSNNETGNTRLSDSYMEEFCKALNILPVSLISEGHCPNQLLRLGMLDCYKQLANSHHIDVMTHSVVPLVFQSVDYMNEIFDALPHARSKESRENFVGRKIKGQQDYKNVDKNIIVTESSLYSPMGTTSTTIKQIRHLMDHLEEFRILPLGITIGDCPNMVIHDRMAVEIELLYMRKVSRDPNIVLHAVQSFQSAWSKSVTEGTSLKILERAIKSHKNPDSLVARARKLRNAVDLNNTSALRVRKMGSF